MIEFIEGKVLDVSPTFIVVKAGHFAYKLQISINTYDAIKNQQEVKLYTHLYVKNEGQNLSGYDLYGFATEEERLYFVTVIGVSGIGTSTARLMLSAMEPNDIARAISLEDVAKITTVKGIGPKTAKRLILELKDKIPQLNQSDKNVEHVRSSHNTITNETLTALTLLGFSKQASQRAIDAVLKTTEVATVEELVKLCLKKL